MQLHTLPNRISGTKRESKQEYLPRVKVYDINGINSLLQNVNTTSRKRFIQLTKGIEQDAYSSLRSWNFSA